MSPALSVDAGTGETKDDRVYVCLFALYYANLPETAYICNVFLLVSNAMFPCRSLYACAILDDNNYVVI